MEAEARAASALMQPMEWFEDLFARLDRDAIAVVADFDPAVIRYPDQERAAPLAVVDGVLYQVGERPF